MAIVLIADSFCSGHLAATIVAAVLRCRRCSTRGAARLRGARRGLACLGVRRVRHRRGLRCAGVRDRGNPPVVRRLGADRRLGGCDCCVLRLPASLPRYLTHLCAGGRRRARAGRGHRGRYRAHLTRRRRPRSRPGSACGCSYPPSSSSALSASVFRIPRHRDLATIMWALGAVALLGSEWLVLRDPTWRAVAYSVTAAGLGLLSRPLREQRLWFAGSLHGVARTGFVAIVAARRRSGRSTKPSRCATQPPASRPRPRSLVDLRPCLARQGAPRSRHGWLGDRDPLPHLRRGVPRRLRWQPPRSWSR